MVARRSVSCCTAAWRICLLRRRWSSTSTARIYIQDTIATVSQLNLAPLQKIGHWCAWFILNPRPGQRGDHGKGVSTVERRLLLGCQKYPWISSAKLGIMLPENLGNRRCWMPGTNCFIICQRHHWDKPGVVSKKDKRRDTCAYDISVCTFFRWLTCEVTWSFQCVVLRLPPIPLWIQFRQSRKGVSTVERCLLLAPTVPSFA